MDLGHFQYVTGLLQLAAGLHAGFAISESFRNLPKKKFDKISSDWIRLNDADEKQSSAPRRIDSSPTAELKVKLYIAEFYESGDKETTTWARRSICWALVLYVVSAVISLFPLPIFEANSGVLTGFYFVTWLLAVIAVFFLYIAYDALIKFWQDKLDELKRTAVLLTGSSISPYI